MTEVVETEPPEGSIMVSLPPPAPVAMRPFKGPRRPPGWVAPGPPGTDRVPNLEPLEAVSYLLGDWRIVQRQDGHRWSLDDFMTAYWARRTMSRAAPSPLQILDLGTGIGSVSLMLAWCFPDAQVTGVEAQKVSFELAQKSVWLNALEERMTLVFGDLRDLAEDALSGHWDLITGTPPYFDDPAQTRSSGVQKGPCRFEERGGIAQYLHAMRALLAPKGRAVICHASRQRKRVLDAIEHSGFIVETALEVVPKTGRAALVDVFALKLPSAVAEVAAAFEAVVESLVVRDLADQWTPEMLAVRLSMGMPPRP